MKKFSEPMLPSSYRVKKCTKEMKDIYSLDLVSSDSKEKCKYAPGQFNMLYAFGVGEVPISVSSSPESGKLTHTIRAVGAVTKALCELGPNSALGLRGPFGSSWPLEKAKGADVLIAAGGLGLAPLRPLIESCVARKKDFKSLTLIYGARTPDDILFRSDLEKWKKKMSVEISVGLASPKWKGTVGHVTACLPRISFTPSTTFAFLCGPEIMMRFTAIELDKRGVAKERIFLSMERNMKCAIGFCGHCQFGPEFICKDGPVFPYPKLEHLLRIREL